MFNSLSFSLSISPTPNCPWLAVGMQPGTMFSAMGNKLVYLLDWETRELHEIFDAGMHDYIIITSLIDNYG